MITGLLMALLHLMALLLVVRLTLPDRAVFMNPYAMAIYTLLQRLLKFLHTAIPLSTKPLCLIALVLVLASRAAISATTGAPVIVLSSFTVVGYNVSHFFGWFGVEVLRFIGFYLSILACVFFLRCWHLGRPLPGYSGDLLFLTSRPYSNAKLWQQGVGLALLFAIYVGLAVSLASVITYPMAEHDALQLQLTFNNLLDFNQYSPLIRGLLLLGTTYLDALVALQNTIFILIFMLLLSLLFGNGPMTQFLFDLKRLICGPIRAINIGPVDLSLLVAYFVLGIAYTLLLAVLLILAAILGYVV